MDRLFLLAYDFEFFSQPDPTTTLIMALVMGAFIGIVVVTNIISSRKAATGKKYSRFGFRRLAKKVGLHRDQIKIMEHLIKKYNIKDPDKMLFNSPSFNTYVSREFRDIVMQNISSTQKEYRKHLLFQIKQTIEANAPRKGSSVSTIALRHGHEMKIFPEKGKESYQTDVVSSTKEVLGLRVPKNRKHREERWPKGTRVKLTFLRYDTQVFNCITSVRGYNTVNGISTLYVGHVNNISQSLNRRHKRVEISVPVTFYQVAIVETGKGRSKKREAVVNNQKKSSGQALDISSGGCGVKSFTPLPRGSLIKIDFQNFHGRKLTGFGKVQGISKEPGRGAIMHVKFTSVSRKNLNYIRSFVYEISEHSELQQY